MSAPTTSHATLVAEVTALRASLGDSVELVESLRSERGKLRDAVNDALAFRDTPATWAKLRAALERAAL